MPVPLSDGADQLGIARIDVVLIHDIDLGAAQRAGPNGDLLQDTSENVAKGIVSENKTLYTC